MSNIVNLTLDVMKASIKNPLITVRQGEGNFETLRATVTANGEPLDLQGFTITFMGTTAGKHKIIDGDVTIIDASKGIFEHTPNKAWGTDVGGFKIAYFKFVSGDGSTSSANFQVEVIEAVDLTQEEAQNYISVVDATISEIDKRLHDSLANVTQSIAETSSAASSLSINVSSVASSAVNQINDTASSAVYNVDSVAYNAVNNFNSTASSAVDNVNNTASNAVNNVNVTASNATNSITSSATSLGNRVDDYNNKLAAIQVGGRNYILNSSGLNASADKRPTLKGSYADGNASISYLDTGIQATNNQGNREWFYGLAKAFTDISATPIVSGNTYTISFKVKGTAKQVAVRVGIKNATTSTESSVVNFTNINNTDWTRVVYTFVIPSGTTGVFIRLQGAAANSYFTGFVGGETFTFKEFKLELGNVATDWSPAPEDAPSNDAQLVHKTGTETIANDKTFTGNTTLSTTTILSGNYGLRVTASGIQKTTDGKTWVSANI